MTPPEMVAAFKVVVDTLMPYKSVDGGLHIRPVKAANLVTSALATADLLTSEQEIRADERRRVVEEQREAGLVVVSTEDLYHVTEIAENYLDMCEPPPADELERVARLRAALPERIDNA